MSLGAPYWGWSTTLQNFTITTEWQQLRLPLSAGASTQHSHEAFGQMQLSLISNGTAWVDDLALHVASRLHTSPSLNSEHGRNAALATEGTEG